MENFDLMEPWNKGRAIGQQTPLTPEQVRAIKTLLANSGQTRDLALFSTAVDSMLRAVDLLALKVEDVMDEHGKMRDEIDIKQQKTDVIHRVAINKATQDALKEWIKSSKKPYYESLFTGETDRSRYTPITRRHYSRLVKSWVRMARLNPDEYSTHSLRRTKASIVYKATNNIEVVRELLGQKSVTATSAYLNVGKRKALEIGKRFEL